MPEVTVAAGIEIDLASREDLERHHDWLRQRLGDRREAKYRVLSGSVAPGTAPLLLRVGASPPAGLLYVVQWVAIFGDDDTKAAITNVGASLRIGVPRSPASAVGGVETIIPGLAVPSVANVPDAVFCAPGQQIYVVIGGTASGSGSTNDWNANVGVLVVEDTDAARAWA